MKIQANASGTRSIEITKEHLETIHKYSLLNGLIDSNGIVDEQVLDKLKLNIRSLLDSVGTSDKALLDLCFDVIFIISFYSTLKQSLKHLRLKSKEES